jgi:hypothetical protein
MEIKAYGGKQDKEEKRVGEYPAIVKDVLENILPYRLIDDIWQERPDQQKPDIQVA